MPQLDKLSVGFSGLLPSVTRFVEEWRPPRLRGETKYRDHLLGVLRAAIPADTKIEKEYRHRGTTLDIWLEWQGMFSKDEICFELKVNLSRKTDYDRLVGQLAGMDPEKNKTIVVLIGDTDLALLGRLKERYAKYLDHDLTRTMTIVQVSIEDAPEVA